MNKRRDVMRVGGWLAMTWGLVSVALAITTNFDWADLAGGYGLMLALTGGWTVAGLGLLSRHERRMAQAQTPSRITSNRQGVLSR
jgi:hypothetical protein